MLRATQAGHIHGKIADTVVLDHEERSRRRATITTVAGLEVLVDLADAPKLGSGDCYKLEDGRLIEIISAAEELLEVRASDPLHVARVAYHLGNRHLECEIRAKYIRIRRDHVIADMLRGLGAKVTEVDAPFQPEGGAYDHSGHAHSHDHSHDHAHDLAHEEPHVHGPGCGHDHDHDHAHDHSHDLSHDHKQKH
jgi:urease accessory protein